MKKLMLVVFTVLVAGVAVAQRGGSEETVTDAQVQAAIDARLHQMLLQLNARQQ